jgi:hypothetical protein
MDDGSGNILQILWCIKTDDAVGGGRMYALRRCQNKVLSDHHTAAKNSA